MDLPHPGEDKGGRQRVHRDNESFIGIDVREILGEQMAQGKDEEEADTKLHEAAVKAQPQHGRIQPWRCHAIGTFRSFYGPLRGKQAGRAERQYDHQNALKPEIADMNARNGPQYGSWQGPQGELHPRFQIHQVMVVEGARGGDVFHKNADAVGAVCGDGVEAHKDQYRQGQPGSRASQDVDEPSSHPDRKQYREKPPWRGE